MTATFSKSIDRWINNYVETNWDEFMTRGRGMVVVRVDGECRAEYWPFALCDEENLAELGVNDDEANTIWLVIWGYDPEIELPVITVGDEEFRFQLLEHYIEKEPFI